MIDFEEDLKRIWFRGTSEQFKERTRKFSVDLDCMIEQPHREGWRCGCSKQLARRIGTY